VINSFRSSLDDASNLQSLYEHCVVHLKLPGDYSDLLRMSFIYCLSTLDKLIHDIIAHEMVEIYSGRRVPTPKYQAESLTFENHIHLANASIPPAEIIFENIVRTKLGYMSFMDPTKLADGLSLVWNESHKWQIISVEMGRDAQQVKTELRNLFKRRNPSYQIQRNLVNRWGIMVNMRNRTINCWATANNLHCFANMEYVK